ncbi:hypothetical protein PLESTF_001722600 [Pleodorina starrii]|nr:hypothetical protein PLESTF_001722600 [Pleodorina starrii]
MLEPRKMKRRINWDQPIDRKRSDRKTLLDCLEQAIQEFKGTKGVVKLGKHHCKYLLPRVRQLIREAGGDDSLVTLVDENSIMNKIRRGVEQLLTSALTPPASAASTPSASAVPEAAAAGVAGGGSAKRQREQGEHTTPNSGVTAASPQQAPFTPGEAGATGRRRPQHPAATEQNRRGRLPAPSPKGADACGETGEEEDAYGRDSDVSYTPDIDEYEESGMEQPGSGSGKVRKDYLKWEAAVNLAKGAASYGDCLDEAIRKTFPDIPLEKLTAGSTTIDALIPALRAAIEAAGGDTSVLPGQAYTERIRLVNRLQRIVRKVKKNAAAHILGAMKARATAASATSTDELQLQKRPRSADPTLLIPKSKAVR